MQDKIKKLEFEVAYLEDTIDYLKEELEKIEIENQMLKNKIKGIKGE